MVDLSQLTANERLLVFAPHPDDDVLACGGLLQRAAAAFAAVGVVFVTDGENNPWPQRFLEHRWRLASDDRARWARLRRREAVAALATLGLCEGVARFLGFPDQGITGLLMTCADATVAVLQELVRTWCPTIIVAPSLQDLHPDHSALMVLLTIALRRLADEQWPVPAVMSYIVHGPVSRVEADVALPLSHVESDRKARALMCHESQMALSRRRLMARAVALETFHPEAAPPPTSDHHCKNVEPPLGLGRWTWKDWIKRPLVRLVADDGECRSWTTRPTLANHTSLGVPQRQGPREAILFLKRERRWVFFDERGWEARVPALSCVAPTSRSRARIVCVVPCYDVDRYCERVLLETLADADCVVAVDDGSRDRTPKILAQLAAANPQRLHVLTLDQNRGKGTALLTGLRFAIEHFDFDAVVTLDSDGQHLAADIIRLAAAVNGGADLAVGARALDEMPLRSRIGNTLSAIVLHRFFSAAPRDTQCGLRALSPAFARRVVALVPEGRYETEARMLLLALENGLPMCSVSIPTLYSPQNRSSHFRPLSDSARILRAVVRWRLKRPDWQPTTIRNQNGVSVL